MKQVLLFLMLCPLVTFGQWEQVGANIDGDAAGDYLGRGLRMNAAGTRIAGGSVNANGVGKVMVFDYDEGLGIWTQTGSDIFGEDVGEEFGQVLDLNADGTILAIGADGNDVNGFDSGKVRVFSFNGADWVQMGASIDGASAGDQFGSSVNLSYDGTTLVIGSEKSDANGEDSGSVLVYKFEANNWVQLGNTIVGENADDRFGFSVWISADGTIISGGAYGNDDSASNAGQVRIFQLNGNTWSQIGDAINGENAEDLFGASLTLSSEGSIVAAASYFNDDNGTDSGYVRIFQNIANTWVQMGSSILGEHEGDNFGANLQLSDDGLILAAGSSGNDNNGNNAGQTRIFQYLNNDWVQVGDAILGDEEFDYSGSGVTLNANGNMAAMGARLYDGPNGASSGLIRVFQNPLLGIEDVALNNEISMYPNPVIEELTISNPTNLNLETAIVYDITGRIIQSYNLLELGAEKTINLSTLTSGVYLIEIKGTFDSITKRIVKR